MEPGTRICLELLREWIAIWNCRTDLRERSLRTWLAVYKSFANLSSSQRWAKVRGIISNVIATLWDIGWQPYLPYKWKDDEGNTWVISGAVSDFEDLGIAIHRSITSQMWLQASNHYNGKGLENGADLVVLKRTLNGYHMRGETQLAGCLRSSAVAGTWCQLRRYLAGYSQTMLCPRCGVEMDDEKHRIWECSEIVNQATPEQLEILNKSEDLKQRAVSEIELGVNECLWLRGIVPAEHTRVPPPTNPTNHMRVGKYIDMQWPLPAGTFYLDGSGDVNDPRAPWSLLGGSISLKEPYFRTWEQKDTQ